MALKLRQLSSEEINPLTYHGSPAGRTRSHPSPGPPRALSIGYCAPTPAHRHQRADLAQAFQRRWARSPSGQTVLRASSNLHTAPGRRSACHRADDSRATKF
jgi:hypothetical protein